MKQVDWIMSDVTASLDSPLWEASPDSNRMFALGARSGPR